MHFFEIVKRDVWFYRRTQIVMGLLACVCCVVLTGALLVGDSVRHSLLSISDMRLGNIQTAMTTGNRFFRQELAKNIGLQLNTLVVPVLSVKGVFESPDSSIRINQINVYGIDKNFWQLAPQVDSGILSDFDDGMLISQSVASRLGQQTSELLLRIQPASQLSKDLIYSEAQSSSKAWPVKIAGIVPDEMLGRFDLLASQAPPLNVFVPIGWLAEKVEVVDKANALLMPVDKTGSLPLGHLTAVLKEAITPQDLGLDFRVIPTENVLELRTSQIFLDDSIVDAALMTGQEPYGILTSFVNEIRCGDTTVPYSTISGIGGKAGTSLLSGLKEDEIVLNEWLADELKADEGDLIQLTYFQITPTRRLVEETASFVVRQIVPMMGSFADPTLMPDYPGLTEADSCSNWDSGIPIDLDRIEQRDEDYWDMYKGTPKAFVSLNTAQTIWKNRFGTLTAVRWSKATNSQEQISSGLMKNLDPGQMGFAFRNVRQTAHQSAIGSTDFAGLFAGLSMFLIFSAALLLALMFVFYVESRTEQVGLLLAVGWSRLKIFSLFLAEGGSVAFAGCVVGAVVSVLYTAGLIVVLNASFWAKALASLQLSFHMTPATLLKGFVISLLICVFAILLSLLRRVRRPVHQLLTGISEQLSPSPSNPYSRLGPLGWVFLVVGLLIPFTLTLPWAQVAMFFAAGSLCLTGLILISCSQLKRWRTKRGLSIHSFNLLAIKSISRKTGRSLAVIITLACGVFMIVGVGANYKETGSTAHQRSSGTGGFSLLAQTTLPVCEPLELKIHDPAIDANAFVPMRIYQQDDASCLNLNRSQQPTLLGVQPVKLAQRNAFSFQQVLSETAGQSPWHLLGHLQDDGAIPAIGDYATVFWGLGKKLGETISYQAETGDTIQLKIVGILKDSLLQGGLLISEESMVHYFPSADGYRQFLIDADWDEHQQQAEALMKKYRDFGMEVISARQKLAQYHEVENTYLAIFLVLGGLGVVLGSAALALVLVLNVLDRQGELAMMQAVGFHKRSLSRMLLLEHGVLLLVGLLCGLIPALLAVLPSISAQGGNFPYVKIVLIAVAIAVNGVVWTRIAVVRLLKKDFLQILRNE
jgi:ABC-type antimicrobial peptide transport system permease subunit